MKNKTISNKVSISSSQTKRKQLVDKLEKFGITLISYRTLRCFFRCEKCGNEFDFHPVTINAKLRLDINPCQKCSPVVFNRSKNEEELYEFVCSIYQGKIERNCRRLFSGSKTFSEVDIYLPDLGIALEFNGIFWHSEIFKNPSYHQDKSKFLLEKKIKLYHVWEDDWIYKREIVQSMIRSALGLQTSRIWARKCEIKEVSFPEYKSFCEKNHLKGFSPASLILGVYYQNQLVSLMSFLKTRKLISSKNSDHGYELIRSCSLLNTSVVGGMSRILSFYKETVNTSLLTYCDMCFSPDPSQTGYMKSGFSYHGETPPGFHWVIDQKRSNRLNWTKGKLIKMGFDPAKSADKIMRDLGHYKIWDCGNYKYEWIPEASPSASRGIEISEF